MQDIIARALAIKAEEKADLANSKIDSLPKGLVYKGAVNYYNQLPSSNQSIGDTYTVVYVGTSGTEEDGSEYVWGNYEGTNQWIELGTKLIAITDQEIDIIFEEA